MKKKILGLLLIVALILISSLVGTSNVYAEENIAHNLTIEDYKDFLLENDLEVYKEFNELSEEEQKEFEKL